MKTRAVIKWALLAGVMGMTTFEAAAIPETRVANDSIEKADYKKLLQQLTPLEGTTPAQWRVTWSGDTASTATISWSTAQPGKKHRLHWGTRPGKSDPKRYSNHLTVTDSGPYSLWETEAGNTKTAHYHHARLTGLKPGTNYYFLLESDGEFSRPLYFRTATRKGPYKLLVGGDSRSGHVARCRVNLRMAQLLEKLPDIIALNHGGDYIQSGKSWRHWRLWLSHHELTTLKDGRVLPVIPTRGNHDLGPLIFEVFGLKKPADRLHFWHTIQLPGRTHLVTLDTNYSAKGAQEAWLKQQLATLRPKSTWLITNYHRPLQPAVKSPAAQTAVFVPLFEKYNVDLACESDGHCIKRTVPIRNGKEDPTGVVYIGEGGLGVGQYRPKPERWYLQGGYVSRGHHVMLLDVTSQSMKISTILLNGKVVDQTELKPRKQ